MVFQKCKIGYVVDHKSLAALRIGEENGIERQDAEEIVNKFKGDKFIKATITDNLLYVRAEFPRVTVDCGLPGEKPIPLRYTLRFED